MAKTATIAVRVDPKLKEQLQRLANADQRTLASYLEVLFREAVSKAPRAGQKGR